MTAVVVRRADGELKLIRHGEEDLAELLEWLGASWQPITFDETA